MFCVRCGGKIPNDAEFCHKCGTAVWKETAPADIASSEAESAPTARASGSSTLNMPRPQLRGVGGWLMLLCILLVLARPLRAVGEMASDWNSVRMLMDASPPFRSYAVVAIAVEIAMAALSAWAGWRLYSRRVGAVWLAKFFFLTSMWIPLALGVILAMHTKMPNEIRAAIGPEIVNGGLISIVSGCLWLAYLFKSERVRNTYPNGALEDWQEDHPGLVGNLFGGAVLLGMSFAVVYSNIVP